MTNSSLFTENTFYNQFTQDLSQAKQEVIIESPFITAKRMQMLYPYFEKLIKRNIKVYIVTRDPIEHRKDLSIQAEQVIQYFEHKGIQVFLSDRNHHRKLAIIDRKILWEGSLNILSQTNSKEIMRRIDDNESADEMLEFIKLKPYL